MLLLAAVLVPAVLLAFLPWRWTMLVHWGSHAKWELLFWHWKFAGGRLRDLWKFVPELPLPEERRRKRRKEHRRRPPSLKRLFLEMWQDRHELWALTRANQGAGLAFLGALTRRCNIVIAGLAPDDYGWISIEEAVRHGAGWGRKLRILPDWTPDAEGGAIRWEIGFSFASLAWQVLRFLCRIPWRLIWKLWRPAKKSRPAEI